jgi:hypothetical protein
VSLQQRYVVAGPDVVARVIDGEAIIINLGNGLYYGTRNVGAVVWEGIAGGGSVEEVAGRVVRQFSVAHEVAEKDVRYLVDSLVGEELIRPDGLSPGCASAAPLVTETSTPYEPPKLEKFSDMAQFLALDPPLPTLEA